jgi:hypothetical protein
MRLVTIEAGSPPGAGFGGRVERDRALIVDAFVDARLLSSRREPEPDGDSVVGVAHEALLRQWTPQ